MKLARQAVALHARDFVRGQQWSESQQNEPRWDPNDNHTNHCVRVVEKFKGHRESEAVMQPRTRAGTDTGVGTRTGVGAQTGVGTRTTKSAHSQESAHA
jgi:hypothetical protein